MVTITLSNSFIEEVRNSIEPHWGELGWVTYKRTYARWIEEENRTEDWHETIKRVVEGNINLDPRLKEKNVPLTVIHELEHEAKQLYKLLYGLAGAASGRNLWISGTDFQKRNGDALNNCWFISIRPQAYGKSYILPFYLEDKNQPTVSMPFSFLFDQLMKGGGVGFSVVEENVLKMPKVEKNIELVVVVGKENGDYDKIISAGAKDREDFFVESLNDGKKTIVHKTPDEREGWVVSEALVIDSHFGVIEDVERVVIDVTDVREEGKRIKGFGGVASGAKPLVELLYATNSIVNEANGRRLSSVELTDIANLIGKTVVAGNVRRSAEIALGSPTDSAYITMKQDQEKLMSHRWASNNSVIVDRSFMEYGEIADSLIVNGEPGIVNMELSRDFGRIVDGYQPNIDPDVEGTNPCGEISLANGEPCNLFDIFPLVAEKQGWDLKEAFGLAARYTKRVTFSNYEWEVSRNIIAKNRRIGVAMSGIQDWVLKNFGGRLVVGYEPIYDHETDEVYQKPIFNEEASKTVDELYQAVVDADIEYSDKLGVNYSIKRTTIKPSGTVSKLAGVSEGIHFHYDRYIIQRIRFQANDPLVPVLAAAGHTVEDDVYSANTKVVEFLVKAASADEEGFVSAGEVSIEEQFASQSFMQTYWADNSVSCTITFHKDEEEKVAPLFRQYRDVTKSTSLLPFSGHGFQQAPKEPISEEVYNERKEKIFGNVQEMFQLMDEVKDLELVGLADCEGGACPVK